MFPAPTRHYVREYLWEGFERYDECEYQTNVVNHFPLDHLLAARERVVKPIRPLGLLVKFAVKLPREVLEVSRVQIYIVILFLHPKKPLDLHFCVEYKRIVPKPLVAPLEHIAQKLFVSRRTEVF